MESNAYRLAAKAFEQAARYAPDDSLIQFYLGQACYLIGEYRKSADAYGLYLRQVPRDAEALSLRTEANQKHLESLQAASFPDSGDAVKVQSEIFSDQAMYLAVHAEREREQLRILEKQLEEQCAVSPERARELMEGSQLLVQNYLSLAAASFGDPKQSEFVRAKLNGLAAELYELLARVAASSCYEEIQRLAPLFDGYHRLVQGDLDRAMNIFGEMQGEFPEAKRVFDCMENDRFRGVNLAALDAWDAYIEEGEATQVDQAKGWLWKGLGFLKDRFRNDRGDYIGDIKARWALERELVDIVRERIRKREASSVQEVLRQIQESGPEKFRERSKGLLESGGERDNCGSYVLANFIEYSAHPKPDPQLAKLLLFDADQLEARYSAVKTPFAIYSLVQATANEEEDRNAASMALSAMQTGKQLPHILWDMVRTSGTDDLVQMAMMAGASKVGALTKLATLNKLKMAGVSGYKAMAIAFAAETIAEGTALWAMNTVHESSMHDTGKVFTAEHLAKSYGSSLIMIGGLKGAGKLGQKYAPQAARAFGLVAEGRGQLSRGGKALSWVVNHGAGGLGMVATTQLNQLLGLSEAPKGGLKESLAHDLFSYVKYGIAQKKFDKALGAKFAAANERTQREILVREAELKMEANLQRLGFRAKERNKAGTPLFVDAQAQTLYQQLLQQTLTKPGFDANTLTSLLLKKQTTKATAYLKAFGLKPLFHGRHFIGMREMSLHELKAIEPEVKSKLSGQSFQILMHRLKRRAINLAVQPVLLMMGGMVGDPGDTGEDGEKSLGIPGHTKNPSEDFSPTHQTPERDVRSGAGPSEVSLVLRTLPVREYQEEAIVAALEAYQKGQDRALVVLPTGTGKTVLFSEIVGRFLRKYMEMKTGSALPRDVLVITHREEIVDQNAAWLRKAAGEEAVGVLQGSRKEWGKPVVSASIQSLIQNRLDLSRFGLVILDEAHHYVRGNEWFSPLIELGFFDEEGAMIKNQQRILFGVTATPDRLSGYPLNTTFGPDGLVYGRDISYFLNRWDPHTGLPYLLSPYGIQVDVQLSGLKLPWETVRKIKSEEKVGIIRDIFLQKLKEGEGYQKTIIFVSNKVEVDLMVKQLKQSGVKAFGLTDETPESERKSGVSAYKRGDYDAMVSIRVPTEGFDDPGTQAIILGTATDSRGLLVQMVGRGLRPDPSKPHLANAVIIDLGGNLQRHQIGMDVLEAYEVEPAGELRKVEREEKGAARPTPDRTVDEVEVRELGHLFKTGTRFSVALKEFISLDDIHRLSFRWGKPSDILFNYWNGLEIPKTLKEARDLSELVGDTKGIILDAWAWEKVMEMEAAQPLPSGLPSPVRLLAMKFRWAIWKHFNGAMSVAASSSNSPLHDFWDRGELPLHNLPRLRLIEFYDQVERLIAGEDPDSLTSIRAAEKKAIMAQRGWDRPLTHLASSHGELLTWARETVVERYKGEIPMSGEGAMGQGNNLRYFLKDGTWPFDGDLQGFCRQLVEFLAEKNPQKAEEAKKLIYEVMKNHNGWDQPLPQSSAPVTALHDWFIKSVLAKRWGRIAQSNETFVTVQRLRNFAKTLELPEPNGRESLAAFYEPMLKVAAGDDVDARAKGKELIIAVVREARGWDSPTVSLNPELKKVLDKFREVALKKYFGQWPRAGEKGLPPRHPLLRFLENGEELSVAEYREDLLKRLGEENGTDRDELNVLLNGAVRTQMGWAETGVGLPHAIIQLRDWLLNQIIPTFRGNKKILGRPLNRFLETGELPEKFYGKFSIADFFGQMLSMAAPLEQKRGEGRALIIKAIKAQRGWDQPIPEATPAIQAVADAFFDIIAEKYWGIVPENDPEIIRGGRLRKFLDTRQWPAYRGASSTHQLKLFLQELRSFLENNGIGKDQAENLTKSAAQTPS